MPPLPTPSEPSRPTQHAPAQHAPAPHSRMSAEDRRRQLIEVAIDLFSQRGFAGTTTREIAAAAGVTEAIIFRHFATKQDFYKAILDFKCNSEQVGEMVAQWQRLMDANDDEGLFRLLITKIIRIYREDTRFERLLLFAALEGHELARMHHAQLRLPFGQMFIDYIERRQREGALRHCDPGLVLCALAGIPQFYAMQKYVHQCGDPGSDEQVIDAFMLILMNGLSTKEQNGKNL